jgi:hypothetical protein
MIRKPKISSSVENQRGFVEGCRGICGASLEEGWTRLTRRAHLRTYECPQGTGWRRFEEIARDSTVSGSMISTESASLGPREVPRT